MPSPSCQRLALRLSTLSPSFLLPLKRHASSSSSSSSSSAGATTLSAHPSLQASAKGLLRCIRAIPTSSGECMPTHPTKARAGRTSRRETRILTHSGRRQSRAPREPRGLRHRPSLPACRRPRRRAFAEIFHAPSPIPAATCSTTRLTLDGARPSPSTWAGRAETTVLTVPSTPPSPPGLPRQAVAHLLRAGAGLKGGTHIRAHPRRPRLISPPRLSPSARPPSAILDSRGPIRYFRSSRIAPLLTRMAPSLLVLLLTANRRREGGGAGQDREARARQTNYPVLRRPSDLPQPLNFLFLQFTNMQAP